MLNTKNKIKLLSASIFSKSISKEMNEVGYKYIPNLIDNSKLNIILDELLNVDENKFKRYDNDIRLFSVYKNINVNLVSFLNNTIKKLFTRNVFLGSLYNHYFMFNKIISSGIGSGGDWHRDSGYLNQYKLIIFLNGTSANNGPFQLLENSHTIFGIKYICKKFGINSSITRFKNSEIEDILKFRDHNFKIKSFHVNPGDGIFVNTRSIHRGKPSNEGGRLALTSYSFIKVPKHMIQLFDG